MVRNITGYGEGHGPYISFHDGSSSDMLFRICSLRTCRASSLTTRCLYFLFPLLAATHIGFKGTGAWDGFMKGADRLILDSHPYLCFIPQDTSPLSQQVDRPCQTWGKSFNSSLDTYGITIAGEWALSFNDCAFFCCWNSFFKWVGLIDWVFLFHLHSCESGGQWVNGVGLGSRWEGTFPGYTGPVGGSCTPWTDWANYNASTKQSMNEFAQATMDALPHWFFWTWKIGNRCVVLWSFPPGHDDPKLS
jgi:glucan 1,3-beta-glucosidase